MRRHATALAVLLVVGSISGCAETLTTGAPAEKSELTGVAESIAPQVDQLVGTQWQLTGSSVSSVDLAAFDITAEFESGTLSGQAPVNRYTAPYEVDGDEITIGPVASTKMAGEPEAMRAEGAFFALLSTVTGFEQTLEELVLLAEEAPVLVFAPAGAEDTEDPQAAEVARTEEVAATLVGLPADEAEAAASAAGLTYRVLAEDGAFNAVTSDFSATRINVEIEDGVVTAATVG